MTKGSPVKIEVFRKMVQNRDENLGDWLGWWIKTTGVNPAEVDKSGEKECRSALLIGVPVISFFAFFSGWLLFNCQVGMVLGIGVGLISFVLFHGPAYNYNLKPVREFLMFLTEFSFYRGGGKLERYSAGGARTTVENTIKIWCCRLVNLEAEMRNVSLFANEQEYQRLSRMHRDLKDKAICWHKFGVKHLGLDSDFSRFFLNLS